MNEIRVSTMLWSLCRLLSYALYFTVAVSALDVQADTLPPEITLPGERIFPESLASTSDGTLFISGVGVRTIFRVLPGSAQAQPWILPETDGMQGVYGVFTDEKFRTLYACSGPSGQAGEEPSAVALYTFDLKTGAPKGYYPLPTPGLCVMTLR